MLTIEKTLDNGELDVVLGGRLDTTTSPDLENALKDDLENISVLKFNLADLVYMSSAGLRVLLAAYKTVSKHGSMKLINVNETINEILEVTGFLDIFEIE